MTIKHNGKTYELVELHEIGESATFDIVAIFETHKDNDDLWELGNFVNYFYGASLETTENIIKIAKNYINESESKTKHQDQCATKKEPKKERTKRLKRINKIIEILGDEKRDFDTVALVEELENLLPFKNKKEHNAWVDLTTSFTCWEDWEKATLKIAKRLEKRKDH